MEFDKTKIDLNKPAFGDGAQTLDDVREHTEEETKEEPVEKKNEEVEDSEEESKVPYSRFKKFHDRSKELEQRIAELEAERERPEPRREVKAYDEEEMDRAWVELYGDSDASKRAYKLDQQRTAQLREELIEEARRSVRAERESEQTHLKENLSAIDEQLEDLSTFIGRDLTKKEEEALLDIVDDYTPKDKNGNYAGATIPFDKAWEIYELKKNSTNAPRKQSRDAVASMTGTQTQGESGKEDKNANWNPLNWNAYKDRL